MTGRPNQGHVYEERARFDFDSVVECLSSRFPRASRRVWLERVRRGEVAVDGRPAGEATPVRRGQRVAWRRPPWIEPDVPLSFAVLSRDEHVLAVAKPRGLPVLPGGGRFQENTLLALLSRHDPAARPVHRLGAGTSGIVLCARTRIAARRLSDAFSSGRVVRVYRALASGIVERDEDVIDIPIGRAEHPRVGSILVAARQGSRARTRYRVLERRADDTLLEVRIETGRTHQIRAHLAHLGHPLRGDPLFLGPGRVSADALPADGGYHLHAERVRLEHPVAGVPLSIDCPPPPALCVTSGPGFAP